jgi:signal transduction histidine kinase
MALGGLLAMVASFGLGLVLSNQTLKPIEAITCAAESISSAKDLKTRLTWTGPMDELGRLTMVFNGMMDRLEHLFGAQRRLIADVSHELRTPLTAVRGHLDLIRRYGVDESSLEAIESEAERMSRLVNDLLTLARADYGSVALDRVELDLDTIVTDVYRHAKILAGDRELKIKLTAVEPVRILGDSDRLKQLLLNLIQNSIKFTPDGGQIHISLRREGSKAVLQVGDTGIGIQPDDLQHIFDRFYQADGSRSRANEQDGAGLGLAIAKWIAEAHDGTIEAQSSPGIWTVFTVRLPVAAAQPETQPPAYESSEHTNSSTLQRLGLNRRKHETAAGGS